jgi:hypothetical protein
MVISKLQIAVLKLQIAVLKVGFGISKLRKAVPKLRFVVFKLRIVVSKLGNAFLKLRNDVSSRHPDLPWPRPLPHTVPHPVRGGSGRPGHPAGARLPLHAGRGTAHWTGCRTAAPTVLLEQP